MVHLVSDPIDFLVIPHDEFTRDKAEEAVKCGEDILYKVKSFLEIDETQWEVRIISCTVSQSPCTVLTSGKLLAVCAMQGGSVVCEELWEFPPVTPTIHCERGNPYLQFRPANRKRAMPANWRPRLIPGVRQITKRTCLRSALLAVCDGNHQWPVDSPHKGPVTWKAFPCYESSYSVHKIIIVYIWNFWWRHQMETFSALLVLREGNPSVTGGFP